MVDIKYYNLISKVHYILYSIRAIRFYNDLWLLYIWLELIVVFSYFKLMLDIFSLTI